MQLDYKNLKFMFGFVTRNIWIAHIWQHCKTFQELNCQMCMSYITNLPVVIMGRGLLIFSAHAQEGYSGHLVCHLSSVLKDG